MDNVEQKWREAIASILADDARGGPPVDDEWCCLGCGSWTPPRHPEAHAHDDGCQLEAEWNDRMNWRKRLRDLLATEPGQAETETESGWIIGDAKGARWRFWGDSGPEWTNDSDQALRFARRIDAEAFARDDEDGWMVIRAGDVVTSPVSLGDAYSAFSSHFSEPPRAWPAVVVDEAMVTNAWRKAHYAFQVTGLEAGSGKGDAEKAAVAALAAELKGDA